MGEGAKSMNAARSIHQLDSCQRSLNEKAWLSGAEEGILRRFLFPHELEEYENKYCSLVQDGQSCIDLVGFRKALGFESQVQVPAYVDQCFGTFDCDGDG